MGYRNDQFFDIERTESQPYGVGFQTLAPPLNPNFIYPDRTIRTGAGSTTLRRGYIRSLARQMEGKIFPIQKCQFQFNPSVLSQTVNQAEGMLNFLQQDPGQYAQPMPSSVNFTFELLFDRSMELNNASQGNPGPDRNGIWRDQRSAYQTGPINEINPWEYSDPSEVGVLRDISALYSAIGQGLSIAMEAYVREAVDRELTAQSTSETPLTEDQITAKKNLIPDFLNMNMGNVAFLLPVPVRVVFSSLYIVEGLVQSSSVTFTKFTSAMVPMQCSVAIAMEAKYIGFAKPKTFLQVALDNQINNYTAAVATDQALVDSIATAFRAGAVHMEIIIGKGTTRTSPPLQTWPTGATLVLQFLNELLGGEGTAWVSSTIQHSRFNNESKVIEPLFDSTTSLSVVISSTVELHGPSVKPTTSADRAAMPLILASTITRGPISTKDDWKKYYSNSFGNVDQFTIPASRRGSDVTSWYSIKYSGKVSVTFTTDTKESVTIIGTGEAWDTIAPGVDINHDILLNKSVILSYGTDVGLVVPPDNATSQTDQPGTSSTIGTPNPNTNPNLR